MSAVGPSFATAQSGLRRFTLFRNGSEIGEHTLSLRQDGAGVRMDIRILIEVRVLGIRAYVYDHTNVERWLNGRLIGLESRTNNDGDDERLSVTRQGEQLKLEGTAFSGLVPATAVPTSYWNYDAFQARPWFSSQSGKMLNLTFNESRQGSDTVWRIGGDFQTTLTYDAAKEWRGCTFDADGSEIVYRQAAPGAAFNGRA